jgi:environmental stress-induced protein Ves
MQVQREADHRTVPWANGLGTTADVFVSPPDLDDWTWRLSLADVTRDVPFSAMPGIDRHILVASGSGMALTIGASDEIVVAPTSPPLSFDGGDATTCRLLDGAIRDLNLMVRRDRATGSMRVVHLAVGEALAIRDDDVAIVVLDGALRTGDELVHPLDALRCSTNDGSGAGRAVVAAQPTRAAVASVHVR